MSLQEEADFGQVIAAVAVLSSLVFETGRRGVFAVGDIRSGSVKRIAAAVGEGAQVVATIHSFLAG